MEHAPAVGEAVVAHRERRAGLEAQHPDNEDFDAAFVVTGRFVGPSEPVARLHAIVDGSEALCELA